MFKILLGWVVGALLLLQLIQIDIPEPTSPIDEIMGMLKTSCYDCHSYETKMPWYGHIFPFSMEVKSHIKEGRTWLNFQEWNTYSDEKKQKIYKGIVNTIDFKMPLPMYLKMHENANLTQIQRDEIKNWAQNNIK